MSYGPKQTLKEGFEKFVVKNTEGCWGWNGCAPKNPGYGQFRSNMKLVRAHRASWIIHFGEIPKGMFVLHKCDNPLCSNPDHLFLGTCKDNNQDMMKKGRNSYFGHSALGERNHKSKLTSEQVLQIRKMIEEGYSTYKIANSFPVMQSTIWKIKSKEIWKELL